MTDQSTHFAFLIEPGFTMQAFSSAVEVLRAARKLGASDLSYSVTALGEEPVRASNGIRVLPDHDVAATPRGAIAVAVAGAGVDRTPNRPLVAVLRRWNREGRRIWGISSGVVRLAQAGLLDGIRVSAHWEDVPYLRDNHPRVELSRSLFIGTARHPTCAGGGAAADLMLDYLDRQGPRARVDEIASLLMIDGVRDGRLRQSLPLRQRYSTANRIVFAAIREMEANAFDALPVHRIAERAGVSQRQLERLFRAEFATTPARVYRELRLDEARQEVLSGRRPLIDIAQDYGFTPGTFARAYERVFGALPSAERKAARSGMS